MHNHVMKNIASSVLALMIIKIIGNASHVSQAFCALKKVTEKGHVVLRKIQITIKEFSTFS